MYFLIRKPPDIFDQYNVVLMNLTVTLADY